MHETSITWFDGLSVHRYNRIPDHTEWFDRGQETWALNYAHRGRLIWSMDGGAQRVLEAPVAFWTWPGPRWTYGPIDAAGWEHVFVSWKGPRARSWARAGLLPDRQPAPPYCSITDPDGFNRTFAALHRLLDSGPPDAPEVVLRSEELLLRLHRQPPPSPSGSVIEAVQRRLAIIAASPQEPWDFHTEAARLDCTIVHLRRVWKRLTGLPPAAWLQKVRLDRAAVLLRTTDRPAVAIAAELGYDNTSLFSRQFRAAKGLPPGRYRRAHRSVD